MQRAWIIGNGPSLKITPLERLIGEVCWATNQIHLIYPQTPWRPTHYVRGESPLEDDAEELGESLGKAFELGIPCYMVACHRGVIGAKHLRGKQKATTREEFFNACEHNQAHYDIDPPQAWHLPSVCTFGSSVTTAIQLAIKEGYGPLYLVGCDLGYTDGGSNHFDEAYENPREKVRSAKYANGDALEGHKIAARSSPVPIYNCTIGGNLEVYPRMTIEEVLDGAGLQPGQGEPRQENMDGGQSDQGPGLHGSKDRRKRDEVRKSKRVQGTRPDGGRSDTPAGRDGRDGNAV